MAQLQHPLKEAIGAVRSILLGAHPELTERIKWNAPSYCYHGDDRVTFNLHGEGFFRLVFHCGAKAKAGKPAGRLLDDATGLLEWVTDDRATVTFTGMQEVQAKETALGRVVRQWIAAAGQDG
ncbi:MAG: DUF1801 domain-containing protein [Cytophagales bacterium]|nr:DUF1801 domain-containing protein [Cytophagales bacterium]